MNILITGVGGQLGTELKRAFITGKTELGKIPSAYADANVLYCEKNALDITDLSAVKAIIKDNAIDLIFNCAAFTNVDACETQQELAFAVNAEGPKNLAIAASEMGATLVHVSSDYVFSGEGTVPRTEDDPCDPQSVYGHSKFLGERYVLEECPKSYVVRSAWVFGYVGKNFVKTILRLARENGAITVVDDQLGTPTNANDLAHELLAIALTQNYGIYHCTNKGICSWFDFACAIVDKAGIDCKKTPCTTQEFLRPAKRPAFSALDNARLRATIGDEMRDWRVALDCYLDNLEQKESAIL